MVGALWPALPSATFLLTMWAMSPARAEMQRGHYVDLERGFRVLLGPAWQKAEPALTSTAGRPVLVVTHARTGQLVVISRMAGPTDGAYARDPHFFALVEQGVKARSPGYQRTGWRPHFLARGKERIPTLDLSFRMKRDGQPIWVATRFLFFKSYALSLVVDAPHGKIDRTTRRLVDSFRPVPK